MDQTKILKYRRTYEDPVKENDVASSQEQEDSKIQIAVSMENLEYLDIVTEDREVMKIYLSWMELKQQEDPQSILNKIKTAGKQCYLMLPQIARKPKIIRYSNSNDVSIGIKQKRDGTVRTSECGPVPLWLSAIDGVCTMREE